MFAQEYAGVFAWYRLNAVFFVTDSHRRRRSREVEEGVSNDLARAVECGLTSSLREHDIRASGSQPQHLHRLFRVVSLSPPKGVDRSMLEEKQEVSVVASGFASKELILVYRFL
ncbi:hypothetical protein NUW54_g1951 [Trametes sanguinea]|uniref:Uncharacterized protein n=1 Tax=Trametes sanguinea TaxID=158606 RepID=A0ACC1Q7A1_9APHY|nr:hypothetical protein NUW54_g1951 [Trametes sanguinea]